MVCRKYKVKIKNKTEPNTSQCLQRYQLQDRVWRFCLNMRWRVMFCGCRNVLACFGGFKSWYVALFSSTQRSIGSDSQGRVTAANNQRQLSSEPRKPFNFLPLHVNTNKSRESAASAPPATTTGGKEAKKQSPGKELFAPVPVVPVLPVKESHTVERTPGGLLVEGRGDPAIDSSQVSVSKWCDVCL